MSDGGAVIFGSTGTINSGTGTTTIQPRTPGTLVALGRADVLTGSPLTLGLSAADLAQITAGTLVVGNASSGTITVSAAINLTTNPSPIPTLELVTGGAIVNGVASGVALTVGSLSLSAVTGIGTPATLLTTAVGTLAAANATSGGVAVTNAADFEVGTVGAVTGVTATGQAVTLAATAGTLTVSQPIAATGPGGSVTLTAGQSVDVAANVTGGGGGVQITGKGLAAVDSIGVTVETGAMVTTTDNGAVKITGTGAAGNGDEDVGVRVDGTITSGGTGAVTVNGTGGAGSGKLDDGVEVDGTVTSGGTGTVMITGTGGAGSGNADYGVNVDGTITSGGAGAVTVAGIGGTGNGNYHLGVFVTGTITSGGSGTVIVTGTGGAGSGGENIGVVVYGTVTSGGTGTVTVTGTGGAGSGDDDVGVVAYGHTAFGNGMITSGGTGAVAVTGISAGGGAFDYGIVDQGSIFTASAAAPITITTDSLTLVPATGGKFSIADGNPGTINSGTGMTTIQPRTADTLVALGGDNVLTGSPLTLGLSVADLAQITAGTLVVGNATAGTITVAAPVDLTTTPTLALVTGAAIVNGVSAGTALTVANLSLSAVTGIGTPATPMTTAVGTLAAVNATAGGASVTNAADFTVGTTDSVSGVTATGQAVTLTATTGTLTVSAPVAATGPTGSVTLTGPSVMVNANVTGGGAGATVLATGKAGRETAGVTVGAAGEVTTTDNGSVTVTGTATGGGSGNDAGVLIAGTIASDGTGTVTVTGTGAGTEDNDAGVSVGFHGSIASNGTGLITVTGTGTQDVTPNGEFDDGVTVGLGGSIASGGSVVITGTGGKSGEGSAAGVRVVGEVISGTGGSITITGTGGSGSTVGEVGVSISGEVTSGGGPVSVTGIAASTFAGVLLTGGGAISTGTTNAPVTITADSLSIDNTSTIDSGTGATTVQTRTAGTPIALGGAGSLTTPVVLGLSTAELAQITAGTLVVGNASSGTITIASDLTLSGENLTLITGAGVTGTGGIANGSATAATLTINQAGTSTYSGAIGGAAANAPNLAFVSKGPGTLALDGNSNYTGTTAVNAGTLFENGTSTGGGAVTANNAATLGGAGSVAGAVSATGTAHVAPGDGPGTLITGPVEFASGTSLDVVIGGPAPGNGVTGYDQLASSGSVDIATGVTLNVSAGGGYVPSAGDAYTIVVRTGGTGTFADLPEGTTIPNFLGSGLSATITYHGGTSGNDIVVQVAALSTSTVLALTPSPSTFGRAVTFTATVTSADGTPDGTVTFVVDGTPVATVTLTGGTATFATATLAAGSHTIIADYNGSAQFQAGASPTQAERVNVATTTTLTSAGSPSTFGQSVTVTATVASAGGAPDGTVTFVVDGTSAGTVTLTGGVATFTTSTLTAGSHTIVADYNGSGNFLTSGATALTQQVTAAATTTTLVAAPTPSTFGQSVTVTATVTSADGAPDGTVTFVVDGTPVATVTLTGGTATFATATLAAGSHTIVADYNGGGNFLAGASTALTPQVNPAATTTTLAVAPAPSTFGQSVTVTATVASAAGAPDGTVTFVVDGTPSGTVTLAGGTATFTMSTLAAGSHTVVADYNGAGNFLASASPAVDQQVKSAAPTATTTTVTTSIGLSIFGEAVPFTATVTGGTPGVTIAFTLDGSTTPFATATLDATGSATVTTTTIPAGVHTVTATYPGDATTTSSTNSVTQTVAQAPTITSGTFPTTVTVRTAFNFTVAASGFPAPTFSVASGQLPAGLTLDPATGAVTGTPTQAGTFTGVIQATNGAGSVDVPFAITATSRPVGQNTVAAFAVSGGPTPTLLNADGSSADTGASPFGPGTTSMVVMTDVTGDGIPDLIYGSGPGTPAKVVVIDGATDQVVFTFTPFEAAFTGGVFVAAGDVDGDGHADIAVSADTGGSGRVIVYSGQTGSVMADFMGIADPNFRGGARVTMGDVNGDGLDDLVVAAGTGGGPRVAIFDGATLRPGQTPTRLIPDFFAFEPTLRDGAYVAVGDVNGDGIGDLVLGGGPTGGPRVLVLDGASLLASNGLTPSTLANFYAGDPSSREGVTVAVKDLGNNGQADLVVDDPATGGTHVVAYQGSALTPSGTPAVYHDYSDAADPLGVYVG
ncbi:putative internalin [Fimbriiglobus ruber]|uniref:Putative internalin n=1 Tax=Fimbriiglobus ruber TaxID=1908690 RepID=A0A225DHI3_9BACT|nr:putative internalin [Fimbriiglobus ruber]